MTIPQHHRAELDGTVLLITKQVPELKHNRVRQDSIGTNLEKL